jgi:hypothetical protein
MPRDIYLAVRAVRSGNDMENVQIQGYMMIHTYAQGQLTEVRAFQAAALSRLRYGPENNELLEELEI